MHMFINLGAETMALAREIVGVFDYKLTEYDSFKEFLAFTKWNTQFVVLPGETKSVVVTDKQIYLAPVSPATLLRRWNKWNPKTLALLSFNYND